MNTSYNEQNDFLYRALLETAPWELVQRGDTSMVVDSIGHVVVEWVDDSYYGRFFAAIPEIISISEYCIEYNDRMPDAEESLNAEIIPQLKKILWDNDVELALHDTPWDIHEVEIFRGGGIVPLEPLDRFWYMQDANGDIIAQMIRDDMVAEMAYVASMLVMKLKDALSWEWISLDGEVVDMYNILSTWEKSMGIGD